MSYKVCVRIDDVCPTMDWYWFDKTVSLIQDYGVKGLIGVIPDSKDHNMVYSNENSDFWNRIVDLQDNGWCVAMHGLHHVYDTEAKGNCVYKKRGSEFAGKTYAEQVQMIEQGKNILLQHGIVPRVFFAPGHNYDNNTIKALAACEIEFMSDGRSRDCYKKNGVIMIPTNRFHNNKGVSTIVLHPSSHNGESEKKYNDAKKMLEEYKTYLIDYSDIMTTNVPHNGALLRFDEWIYVKYMRIKLMLVRVFKSII